MAGIDREAVAALGTKPIEGASPVGEPVRWDESFQELQGQMDRIASLTGEQVDWKVVVDLSTSILRSKAKDMLVMTYLNIGLFEESGYDGLAGGLEAYRGLIETYWESCFPKLKPPRGRVNALQYLSDRILPQVETKDGDASRKPGANEKEAVHACADGMEKLLEAADKAFEGLGDGPNLAPLNRAFRALRQKVGPLEAEKPADADAGLAEAGEAAPAQAGLPAQTAQRTQPSPSLAGAGGDFNTAAQAVQTAIKVAKYLLSQDDKDARSYRLLRAVHFGGLASPPADKVLPPPPATRRTFFENLVSGGDWPRLLTEAEGQFAITPLWLDMQRYAASAAKGMGGAYAAVGHAIVFETVALQARLPEVFDRSFKDGSPFADGATKAWLEQAAGELGIGGGGGGVSGGADDPLTVALGEARKLLSDSKQPEAVARLSAAVDVAGSMRDRFRARLALAELCVDVNKPGLAVPLLEGLDALIGRFELETWEPGLAAQALRMLYECRRKGRTGKPTPEQLQGEAELYGRVCRLDPAGAFKLDAPGGS